MPNPPADEVATLERLLASRYSCRGFLPDAVPRPVIERILSLAQRTPSWCNSQPWQVVVTEGAATDRLRAALYEHAKGGGEAGSDLPWPREYRGVYLQRRRESGFGLYKAVGIARDDMAGRERQSLENYRFFGAPHLALITSDEALGPYGAVDCGAYVSTFLLAAETGTSSAASLSALPIRMRRRTAFARAAPRSRRLRPSSTTDQAVSVVMARLGV
jgi:nitroreductase